MLPLSQALVDGQAPQSTVYRRTSWSSFDFTHDSHKIHSFSFELNRTPVISSRRVRVEGMLLLSSPIGISWLLRNLLFCSLYTSEILSP
jgi:hypothetical protein